MSQNSKVIYPMFTECKDYTLDPFFQDLLQSCAEKRFPKGLRMIEPDTLIVNNGTTKEAYHIPTDDPCQLWVILREIFKEKLGLYSSSEFVLDPEKIKKSQKKNKAMLGALSWSTLKSKKLKDQLVIEYVKRLKIQHNLPWNKAREIRKLIDLHLHTIRDIQPEDVIFKNGQIVAILPLKIDENSIIITKKMVSKIERTPPLNSPKKTDQIIERYLKTFSTKFIMAENK